MAHLSNIEKKENGKYDLVSSLRWSGETLAGLFVIVANSLPIYKTPVDVIDEIGEKVEIIAYNASTHFDQKSVKIRLSDGSTAEWVESWRKWYATGKAK